MVMGTQFMNSQGLARLVKVGALVAVACAGCAGFPVPRYWPVEVAPAASVEQKLRGVVKSAQPISALSHQERALLTFIANPQHVRDAIGLPDKYGTRTWEVIEVFMVEPGQKVSVLAEEGHDQEALYFQYHASERAWYRVKDFEDSGRGVLAVRVR